LIKSLKIVYGETFPHTLNCGNKFVLGVDVSNDWFIGSNNCIDVWRKGAEVNRSDLVCRPSQRKVSVMIWGYLSLSGIGTLTDVKGNINSLFM
jgi:hypothetical protein